MYIFPGSFTHIWSFFEKFCGCTIFLNEKYIHFCCILVICAFLLYCQHPLLLFRCWAPPASSTGSSASCSLSLPPTCCSAPGKTAVYSQSCPDTLKLGSLGSVGAPSRLNKEQGRCFWKVVFCCFFFHTLTVRRLCSHPPCLGWCLCGSTWSRRRCSHTASPAGKRWKQLKAASQLRL